MLATMQDILNQIMFLTRLRCIPKIHSVGFNCGEIPRVSFDVVHVHVVVEHLVGCRWAIEDAVVIHIIVVEVQPYKEP